MSIPTEFGVITFPRNETRTNKSHGRSAEAVFGVQYTPHRRVSVFGEMGLRYSDSAGGNTKASGVGNTATVGVVMFLR